MTRVHLQIMWAALLAAWITDGTLAAVVCGVAALRNGAAAIRSGRLDDQRQICTTANSILWVKA